MKKILLSLAAAVAAFNLSAFTETPIVTFDYSNISEVPAYVKSSVKASADLNFNEGTSYAWPSYGSSSVDGKGVFVISGNTGIGQWASGFEKGFSAATLSEKSGSAFCINGDLSGLSTLYPEITAQHSYFGYYGLHWIANASLISALPSDAYVRVRITFNATDADAANTLIDGIVIKKPGAGDVSNSSITGKLYSDVFPEGHSADKWAVYEFDMPKTQNPSYVSFKTPSGQGQNIALLISKVEFIQLSDKADNEEYITTPQITLQEIDNSGDKSTFEFGDVTIRDVAYNLPSSTIDGITETSPANLTKANAFCVPVTVTPDTKYAGYSAKYNCSVTGVWGNTANNKTSNFTIEVPASESSATGYIEFLPYTNKGTHTVNITGVTYSKEGEDDVTFTLDNEYTLTSSFSASIGNVAIASSNGYTYRLVYQASDEDSKYMLLKYSFTVGNTSHVGYVSYTSTGAEITTENWADNSNHAFGLTGYTGDADECWPALALQSCVLPIYIKDVTEGTEITTTVKVVYPFVWGATFVEEAAAAALADDEIITVPESANVAIYTAQTGAKTNTTTVTSADINGLTGVSDVAVDGNQAVEYYNLQGVRVANPENGIYIRRQGNNVTKVAL